MKKKILCIALAILMLLSLVGCAAQDVRVSFDQELPFKSSTKYEKSVYKVEKFTRKEEGKTVVNDQLIAKGEYVMEIIEDTNFTLTTTFTITYENIDAAIDKETNAQECDNRGLTDTMTSTVVFNEGMSPLSATKTFTVAQRPQGSVQLTGYTYHADYNSSTIKVQRKGEEEKTYKMEEGTKYDNEQMAVLLRAMSATAAGGTASYYLVNPYDSLVKDQYVRYPMSVSYDKERIGVTLDPLLKDKLLIKDKEGEVKKDDNGNYTVSCVQATTGINSTESGPSIFMQIMDPDLTISDRNLIPPGADSTPISNKKLIVTMRFIEYSLVSLREFYNTIYTLTDYSMINI